MKTAGNKGLAQWQFKSEIEHLFFDFPPPLSH